MCLESRVYTGQWMASGTNGFWKKKGERGREIGGLRGGELENLGVPFFLRA